MRSAEYGRMDLGKCLRIDYGNIGKNLCLSVFNVF